LILTNQRPAMSWPKIIDWFENEVKWKKIFTDKHSKIDDSDGFFKNMGEDIGADAAKLIIPLLD